MRLGNTDGTNPAGEYDKGMIWKGKTAFLNAVGREDVPGGSFLFLHRALPAKGLFTD